MYCVCAFHYFQISVLKAIIRSNHINLYRFVYFVVTVDMLGGAVVPQFQHLYKNKKRRKTMHLFMQTIFSLSPVQTLSFLSPFTICMPDFYIIPACSQTVPSASQDHIRRHICEFKTIRIVLPSACCTLCH